MKIDIPRSEERIKKSRLRVRKRQKLMALSAKGKVLDCGFSWNPNPYLKHVTGIDVGKVIKPENYNKVVSHDLNNPLPFKDKSFDTVTAGEVIEHLYNPLGFIKEVERILKVGGKFIFSTPNRSWGMFTSSACHIKEWKYGELKRMFTRRVPDFTKLKLVKAYGYTILIPLLRINIKLERFPSLWKWIIMECVKIK